jgi:hypothetical protein
MVASLVFLTPLGALAMLAVAIPLAGLALAARRERQARDLLGLAPPPPVNRITRVTALVAVPVVLGLAATQPALRSVQSANVRTDAQAFFVVDVSRSMLASRGPDGASRFDRAKEEALRLRDAIPEVPAGIATLTDRVVPGLFPNSDRNVFGQTLNRAVRIQEPPPTNSGVLGTSLGALGSLGTDNFFEPSAKRRLVVVLTDGESLTFDPGIVARDLAKGPGIRLVLVHTWDSSEKVYTPEGAPEPRYRARTESLDAIASLMRATGGRSFREGSVGDAAGAVRAAAGSGPTKVEGRAERTRTLAPYVALLALLPLLFVLPRPGRGLGSALRLFGAEALRNALAWIRHRRDYSPQRARVRPARQRS